MLDFSLVIVAIIAFVLALIIAEIVISPFRFPFLDITVNTSNMIGNRESSVDHFLMDDTLYQNILENHKYILLWKEDCYCRIRNTRFKKLRQQQYDNCLDEANEFRFYFESRPKDGRHYLFSRPLRVRKFFTCDFRYLEQRHNLLKELQQEK